MSTYLDIYTAADLPVLAGGHDLDPRLGGCPLEAVHRLPVAGGQGRGHLVLGPQHCRYNIPTSVPPSPEPSPCIPPGHLAIIAAPRHHTRVSAEKH